MTLSRLRGNSWAGQSLLDATVALLAPRRHHHLAGGASQGRVHAGTPPALSAALSAPARVHGAGAAAVARVCAPQARRICCAQRPRAKTGRGAPKASRYNLLPFCMPPACEQLRGGVVDVAVHALRLAGDVSLVLVRIRPAG